MKFDINKFTTALEGSAKGLEDRIKVEEDMYAKSRLLIVVNMRDLKGDSVMIKDVWLTVEEATSQMLSEIPLTRSVWNDGRYLNALNENDVTILKVRIFDGSEHKLAKPGMVLDWTGRL